MRSSQGTQIHKIQQGKLHAIQKIFMKIALIKKNGPGKSGKKIEKYDASL